MANDILSSTLAKMVDKERDLLFESCAFLDAAGKAGGIHNDATGSSYKQPVVTQDHSAITQFSGAGFQAYNTSVQDSLDTCSYDYAMAGISALISSKQLLLNSGDEAKVKLAEQRIRQVRASFGRSFEQQIMAGSVVTLSDLNSLYGGVDSGSASASGFLYGGATPTNGGTVGGLSRAGVIGLQNVYHAYGGSDFQDDITEAMIEAQSLTEMGQVGALFMSPERLAELSAESLDILRYKDGSKDLDAGVVVAYFRGCPVYVTRYMPTNVEVYGVNFEGIHLHFAPGEDFRFNRYERIPGTETEIASISVFGQLVASHLASSFVISRSQE